MTSGHPTEPTDMPSRPWERRVWAEQRERDARKKPVGVASEDESALDKWCEWMERGGHGDDTWD